MSEDRKKVEAQLLAAGLSDPMIKAAWPSWWRDDIDASPSARAELRFALARRLGLAPKALVGDRIEFRWKGKARFKYLNARDGLAEDALTSVGAAVGRLLIKATPQHADVGAMTATEIRAAILAGGSFVDLSTLLSLCWSVGIPVVHLRVFPLATKAMHAMVIEDGGRHAILLGKDASYPAPAAFTLAHELGHIGLDHLSGASAIVDLEDPATHREKDEEEKSADEYALTLLTGQAEPIIQTDIDDFDAPTLAGAVMDAGPKYGIDPATLALCLAYQRGVWARAMSALKFIYGRPTRPWHAWETVNGIADSNLQWDEIGDEAGDFLRNLMTEAHA